MGLRCPPKVDNFSQSSKEDITCILRELINLDNDLQRGPDDPKVKDIIAKHWADVIEK